MAEHHDVVGVERDRWDRAPQVELMYDAEVGGMSDQATEEVHGEDVKLVCVCVGGDKGSRVGAR